MTARLITNHDDLVAFAGRMRRESRLAFDTEAASFHRYNDRVYLLQVSAPGESAIIDPLAVTDLEPIGALLADPGIEIVFHDADYDLRSLDRDYGFRARRIFDTRIAAQLLGEPGVGLGALLQKYFGVTLNKKMQRADWSVRPLTAEMIEYAAADTAHLPALRDVLETELRNRGRLAWAEEEFARLEAVRWTGVENDPENYLRLKGARSLPPQSQLLLRALHAWREERARSLDRAPFRILQNETLLALAQAAPRDVGAMRAVPGVPSSVTERYGRELIQLVVDAAAAPPEAAQKRERVYRRRPDAQEEMRFERLKQLRNDRARELGLEPGVLGSNASLAWLARMAGETRQEPDGESDGEPSELRRWQRAALGEDRIVLALAATPP